MANFLTLHLSPLLQGLGRQGAGNAMALPCLSQSRGCYLGPPHLKQMSLLSCNSFTLFRCGILMIAGEPLLLSPETPSCSKSLANKCTSIVCSGPVKQHFSTGRAGCFPPKLLSLSSALHCFTQQLLGSTCTQPTLTPQPQDTTMSTKMIISLLM